MDQKIEALESRYDYLYEVIDRQQEEIRKLERNLEEFHDLQTKFDQFDRVFNGLMLINLNYLMEASKNLSLSRQ
jgi:predicted RNase H-like nuclease (RuvC/YqgF family)